MMLHTIESLWVNLTSAALSQRQMTFWHFIFCARSCVWQQQLQELSRPGQMVFHILSWKLIKQLLQEQHCTQTWTNGIPALSILSWKLIKQLHVVLVCVSWTNGISALHFLSWKISYCKSRPGQMVFWHSIFCAGS